MFLRKIDWDDPEFAKYSIENLGELSEAQEEAFWADPNIDDPPLTKEETIDLCKKYECKVELFHGNLCYGIERDWPKKYFNVESFEQLTKSQQKGIRRTMEVKADLLYKKFVNTERMKRRCKRHNLRTMAPFWEKRRLRNQYERIKNIGESEKTGKRRRRTSTSILDSTGSSASRESFLTVINTQETQKRQAIGSVERPERQKPFNFEDECNSATADSFSPQIQLPFIERMDDEQLLEVTDRGPIHLGNIVPAKCVRFDETDNDLDRIC